MKNLRCRQVRNQKMGFYKYLRELWKKPKESFGREKWRDHLVELRRQPAILRVERPLRLDRAHSLGYKAKEGYFIVRSKVTKGGRKRPAIKGGRRPKRYGRFVTPRKSDRLIAEERAARMFSNAEVLNSYWIGQDGRYKWYEIIFVDRAHPAIKADKKISWITKQRGRVHRGRTSAGKKVRGLRKKGKGSVKYRPSKRAHSMK